MRTRRQVLKRRRRERQLLLFGLMLIGLGTVAFGAASVYSERTAGPFSEPIITIAGDFGSEITLACPPADTLPLPAGETVVRVLNSTKVSGLAGTALGDMIGRGFISGGATNWSKGEYDGVVRISFGEEGVAQAYTVARHFVESELVLDTRDGRTVDVVLGLLYDEKSLRLLSAEELDADIPLSAASACRAAKFIVAEPGPKTLPVDPTVPLVTPDPTVSPASDVA